MNILLQEIARVLIIRDLDYIQRGEIIYKKHPLYCTASTIKFFNAFPRLNY